MSVKVLKNNIFVLETKNTHYAFGIDSLGYNRHIHWGKKCREEDYFMHERGDENSNHSRLDGYMQEYTPFGGTMYRECSIKATFPDGCREIVLEYKGCEAKENTLVLSFKDKAYPLDVNLHYEVSDKQDIITRFVSVKNTGEENIRIEKIMSAEFSLPGVKPYLFKNTNGAWGGESIEAETLLKGGSLVFDSRRGTTGHNMSPYFIAHRNATEKDGDVYFGVLAHSGCFKAEASRDLFSKTRVSLGLNDFDFAVLLHKDETFTTPEVFCGYVKGFGEMSRQLNRFALQNVLPKSFSDKPLPVLYNSWEATYFDVSTKAQSKLAAIAKAVGVELFVMDDGWFGKRNNDHSSLGDWVVNKRKFPKGLSELIKNVNNLGMDFGLWFEPEMVCEKSELFKAHPDWAYHYDTRQASELRWQRVLNLTREDVKEYLFRCLDDMLTEYNIKYIKWDMNRPFSETGAQNLEEPKELWYRHTMAVYEIVDRLKEKHPDVAIESCSSGGGRTDYGALSHFDQTWPSDNTDAVDRMVIQKGYTLTRPTKTMRAWVTDIEGYNKDTSLDFRFNIAMQGALGIGGNLTKYSALDVVKCRHYVSLYKEIRNIVQFGDLYRLLDIDEDEVLANLYMTEDKTEGVLFLAANGTRFFKKHFPLYFDGLDENKTYKMKIGNMEVKKSGAYLMNVGVEIEARCKDWNHIVKIKEVK